MVGTALDPAMTYRQVTTSIVQKVEKKAEDEYEFVTENSTYSLKVLGTEEVE